MRANTTFAHIVITRFSPPPMYKTLTLTLWTLALAATATAQTIAPVVITGFNADIVANGPGPAAGSATDDMDGGVAPNQYCFVAADFVNPIGDTPTSSLPTGGVIISGQAPFPTFQLGDYTAANSLRLPGLSSGTLTLPTPRPANELWLLAASGNGPSDFDALVTFTDQTTQLFSNQFVDDWFDGAAYAIQGVSRVNYSTDIIEHSAVNPRLYQLQLSIAATNRTKLVQSLTLTKTTSLATLNVMAVSANVLPMGTKPAANAPTLTVAPNPATGQLTVQHPAGTCGETCLLDLTGRTVLTAPTDGSGATTLDVTALPAGVYLMRYADARQHRVVRVVKE